MTPIERPDWSIKRDVDAVFATAATSEIMHGLLNGREVAEACGDTEKERTISEAIAAVRRLHAYALGGAIYAKIDLEPK